MPATHKLKTVRPYFNRGANRKDSQRKSAELRLNDRNFKVGDSVVLQEYDPNDSYYPYSGREATFVISDIEDFPSALYPGWCMLSFDHIKRNFFPDFELDSCFP